ncbi:cell division ATP-binding protein FtsE [Natronogracilivirga saccharolytica]|uniref:Cell division ATP-binding protein FtsE n=1 Tax=Natronogracilivirga saccharolytica TaxID=2812953 RepID=A0A8J7RNS3_9BACT|nr:cell division ATP-binding protein FtsE [Natronogracilivirga saccharolytica]MBP3193144.1 cell division ATP-binding protein FtsE [Natronogracilivirga saccharolytica]
MDEQPVISFKNITVRFDDRTLFDDLNFTLDRGEFTYLIGSTGSGKSSFLKLIYRDLLPDEGEVYVAGTEVTSLSERKVPELRRSVGIVFQDFQLLPDRNVYENVAFALEVTGTRRSKIKQRVMEVLSMVGLSHRRYDMPEELSGGEQQRVVIARALANEPKLMLADEPTGNLDPEAAHSIMDLFRQINNRGMAVLMVTHNYDMVKKYPARTVRIQNENIVEAGT